MLIWQGDIVHLKNYAFFDYGQYFQKNLGTSEPFMT